MYCKNCGAEIYQDQKFCQNCGSKIENEVVTKVEMPNTDSVNTTAKKSRDGLGTASLVIGIISLVLCMFNLLILPLAIIGLILGICSRVKNKKTPAGLILNIVATILCILIFAAGTALMLYFENNIELLRDYAAKYGYDFQDSKYSFNTTGTTNTTNNNTNDNKYSTGYKTVGDSTVGYIKVPNTFVKFYDLSGVDAVQYSTVDKSWIVTIKKLKDGVTKYSYTDTLYQKLKSEDVKDLSKRACFVGESKTLAYKLSCYYEDDGIYLNIWIFEDSDGSPYFVSIEGPTKDSEYFNLIDTFTFEK